MPRILLRIFPEFFEEFSCFVSWKTETRKNSPKIPAIFQCKIPRQTRKKNIHKILLESRQSEDMGDCQIWTCRSSSFFFFCVLFWDFPDLSVRGRLRGRTSPSSSFPCLTLVFLAFFLFKEVLAILSVFPFFPKDFRGSASRRNPCLFGGFPCCFPKRRGKEDQGRGQTEPKRRFSLIIADSCRFSPFPRKQSIWEAQIFARNHRKPQIGVHPLRFVPLSAFLFWDFPAFFGDFLDLSFSSFSPC